MKFSPMFPTSASPHVFFRSETDRLTACIGPIFSTTRTGTTKNVTIDHAVPSTAADDLAHLLVNVLDHLQQHAHRGRNEPPHAKICGSRANAMRNPSVRLGVSP